MRILLTTTRVLLKRAVLILLVFAGGTESNPERDRNKHSSSSANLEMMDHHFNHDIHDVIHDDDPFGHPSSSGGLIGLDQDSHLPAQGACEPIKVGLCQGIGYNHTTMPNSIGHDAQADADALLQTFSPLIQYGCSPHLKLFLCSAYVPMCTDKVPQAIGPCQSLCESVKSKCEPVLKEFGFTWPPSLECSKFTPENNHEHMCNPGPTQHYSSGGSGSMSSGVMIPKRDQGYHSSFPSDYQNRDRYAPAIYGSGNSGVSGSDTYHSGSSSSNNNNHKESPSVPVIRRPIYDPSSKSGSSIPFVPPNGNPKNSHGSAGDGLNQSPKVDFPFGSGGGSSSVSISKGGNENGQDECLGPRKIWMKGTCWIKCYTLDQMNSEESSSSSLFHSSEKSFARSYAFVWAVLSLSAALIALTLSVCSPRLSVAERPILYLALCQVLYSIGVIIGSTSLVSCSIDKATNISLLAKGGMIPSSCALVFLLTYFFGTATTMWWIILCLTWLISLNRDMASSLLQKEWSVFHLLSWGVASILTSTALVHKKVDADELTGICGVGFQDMEALSLYNMIPLSISLTLGLIYLAFGLGIRVLLPNWNLPVCQLRFLKRKSPTSGQSRMAGCELSNNSAATTTASHQTGQTHTNLPNSFRAPHGYSPVLVLPPTHPQQNMNTGLNGYSNCNIMDRGHLNQHHHPHGHFANCMCSNGSGGSSGHCGGMMMANGMGNGANNNNHHLHNGPSNFYSSGNSPASVVGVGGFQRLRALENTKAIWMRIGIFALVHSLPIACQVGTILYELLGRENWENGKERPNLQIFLLRLNMNLIAGLTTGVWVLSTYSWKSFSTFTRRFCTCLSAFPKKTKSHTPPHEQKVVVVPNSVVAPLLAATSNNVNLNVNHPPIPVPSGSSSSSNNNHNSTMPILGSNNTFNARGALAPQHITSGGPRIHHYNYPLPPVPPRNPDHNSAILQQQRTDAWRRGETIV